MHLAPLSLSRKRKERKRGRKKKKYITGAFQVKVYDEGGGEGRGEAGA